jgi:2-oxoglutarate ferredoxin oxidoreductase subunit alpha
MVRPVTLWPFPEAAIAKVAAQPSVKAVLAVEMSAGQMVDDVRIAVNGAKPVHFYGRTGGVVPMPGEIAGVIAKLAGGDQ